MSLLLNLAHGAVIAGGTSLIFLAKPGSSLFSYHPVMMSAGVVVLAFESAFILKDKRIPEKYKETVPLVASSLGLVCAVVGAQAIFRFKALNNKPHFTTLHGRLGMLTMGVLSIQALSGVPALFSRKEEEGEGEKKVKSVQENNRITKAQKFGSFAAGTIVDATILSAFFSDWFRKSAAGRKWWILLALVLFPRGYLRVLSANEDKMAGGGCRGQKIASV